MLFNLSRAPRRLFLVFLDFFEVQRHCCKFLKLETFMYNFLVGFDSNMLSLNSNFELDLSRVFELLDVDVRVHMKLMEGLIKIPKPQHHLVS